MYLNESAPWLSILNTKIGCVVFGKQNQRMHLTYSDYSANYQT